MNCWANKYMGQRVDTTLEDNCLGLARRILREQFNAEVPGMLGALRTAFKGGELPVSERRGRLRDGTLVVMGNTACPVRHVGVYCAQADRVIHAVTDEEPKRVRAESLSRLRAEWPSILFYEAVRQ